MSRFSRDGFRLDGWRSDLEDRSALRRDSTNIDHIRKRKLKSRDEFDPRRLFSELDPRDDAKVEDQEQQGSCAGHAGTSVLEVGFKIAGKDIQLSRGGLYYMAQEEDGITGDRGSTIHGCAKVVTKRGVPSEMDWPYPPRYEPTPPRGIEDCTHYLAGSHTFLNSAEEVLSYNKAGIGGVQIGVTWGGKVDQYGEYHWEPEGGGHSVALLGWKFKGRKLYTWLLNSWGVAWGDRGWALVSMDTVDRMFRDRTTVMVGYSDMESPDIREIPVNFIDTPTI